MDETTKRKVLRQIASDRAKLRAEMTKLDDFEAYIVGEPAPAPDGNPPIGAPAKPQQVARSQSGPTLRHRVSEVFAAVPPGEYLAVPEIADRMRTAGWDTTSSNALAVLRRVLREMAEDGTLSRPDRRLYGVAAPTLAAVAQDGGHVFPFRPNDSGGQTP